LGLRLAAGWSAVPLSSASGEPYASSIDPRRRGYCGHRGGAGRGGVRRFCSLARRRLWRHSDFVAVYGDAPYGTGPTDTAEFEATPALFIDSIN
jgi:hypothetical protein